MADPLEALLRPVANYLNRTIAEVTPARELCGELDGSVGRNGFMELAIKLPEKLMRQGGDAYCPPYCVYPYPGRKRQ